MFSLKKWCLDPTRNKWLLIIEIYPFLLFRIIMLLTFCSHCAAAIFKFLHCGTNKGDILFYVMKGVPNLMMSVLFCLKRSQYNFFVKQWNLWINLHINDKQTRSKQNKACLPLYTSALETCRNHFCNATYGDVFEEICGHLNVCRAHLVTISSSRTPDSVYFLISDLLVKTTLILLAHVP